MKKLTGQSAIELLYKDLISDEKDLQKPENPDVYLYINNFLSSHPLTIYDNIVKLCDLFCLDKGFTTIEKRILDVYTRKGIYENSLAHFQSVLKLKEEIEKQMGCTLYKLFPEIDEKDINSVNDDYQKVIDIIKEKSPINKK